MKTEELKTWEQLIDFIKENNARVEIDKNENLNIHIKND